MSKAEILTELPKLKAKDRREIWRRLGEMDGFQDGSWDDELSDSDRALIEARLADHDRNPKSAISLQELQSRLKRRLRK